MNRCKGSHDGCSQPSSKAIKVIVRKVGYLGYANGMSNAEWLAVNLAEELLTEQGKNWREYFNYKVDSSD